MTCGLSEVCPDRNAEDVVVVLLAYANIQHSCKSMTTVLFQCSLQHLARLRNTAMLCCGHCSLVLPERAMVESDQTVFTPLGAYKGCWEVWSATGLSECSLHGVCSFENRPCGS
jgi:hypothetical protein